MAIPGLSSTLRARIVSSNCIDPNTDNMDNDSLIMGQQDDKLTFPLMMAVFVATLGAAQYGYHIGVINTPAQVIKENLISGGAVVDEEGWSWVVSIFCVGGVVGSYIGGILAEMLGRKKFILVNVLLFTIASLIMFFASSLWELILARFIVGCGSGGTSVVVPLYLGEIAPASLRGALGTMTQFAVVIGILVANILGKPFGEDPDWRYLLALCIVPSFLQILGYPFLLESPRWLSHKGFDEQAEINLIKLRGTDDVEMDLQLMADVDVMEEVTMERQDSALMLLFRDSNVRLQILVGIVLHVTQQFSGINAVFYYSSSFFNKAGIENDYLGTVLAAAVNVLATALAIDLMDRLGRRPLLLMSAGGMFLSCCFLTGFLYLSDHSSFDEALVGYGAVASILVYVIFFEIGLGPIPWLIVAEIFPAEHRSSAMGLCSGVNWFCNFAVGKWFPAVNGALGDASFVPFALVCLGGLFFTMLYVPETKGKSLEDIQRELSGERQVYPASYGDFEKDSELTHRLNPMGIDSQSDYPPQHQSAF